MTRAVFQTFSEPFRPSASSLEDEEREKTPRPIRRKIDEPAFVPISGAGVAAHLPDQPRVIGCLAEIFSALYAEGRTADRETAAEILNRLEKANDIPSSELLRNEYKQILLEEYGNYIIGRVESCQGNQGGRP